MHKLWNEISESWAIGDNENEVAQELGITVEEVREVYSFQEKELEKYFEQQKQKEVMPPEDENYYEISRNWSKP